MSGSIADMEYVPGVSELRHLRQELRVLAAPAAGQVAWLEATDFPIEELALSFDDALLWVPVIEREGMLPELAKDRVAAVNSAFAALRKVPGNEKWAATSALSTVPEWTLVREAARAALDALGTGGEETDPFASIRTDWIIAGLRQNIDLLAEPPDLQGELLDASASAMNSFIINLHDLLATFRARLEAPGGLEPDALTAILSLDRAAQDIQATAPGAPVDRAGLDTDAWRGLRDLARRALAVLGDAGKQRSRPEPPPR
jgi:hypothetical protein